VRSRRPSCRRVEMPSLPSPEGASPDGQQRDVDVFQRPRCLRRDIQGLVISHFVPPDQGGSAALKQAAVGGSSTTRSQTTRTGGLYVESGSLISGNYVHHNSSWDSTATRRQLIVETTRSRSTAPSGAVQRRLQVGRHHQRDDPEQLLPRRTTTDLVRHQQYRGALEGNTVVKTNTSGRPSRWSRIGTAIIRNNSIDVGSAAGVAIMVNNSSNEQIYATPVTSASSITEQWGVIDLFYDSSRTGYDTAQHRVRQHGHPAGSDEVRGQRLLLPRHGLLSVLDDEGQLFQNGSLVPSLTGQNWVQGSPTRGAVAGKGSTRTGRSRSDRGTVPRGAVRERYRDSIARRRARAKAAVRWRRGEPIN
jgi:hypothetical protein